MRTSVIPNFASLRQRFLQNAIDAERPLASAARWPRWLLACLMRRPATARFETGGLKMRLIPRLTAFGTTSIYIKRDNYEPELKIVKKFLRDGDVALDIGASFGIFSLFMATYVGAAGKIYAFEPGTLSFSQLGQNVRINGLERRIETFNVAASDRQDVLKLYHNAGSPVNFSIGQDGATPWEEVQAARADQLVPVADHARVRFIKIDVEGYEKAALEGARAILERSRPAIMFEVAAEALERQRLTPRDIYEFLRGFGYSFHVVGADGRPLAVEGYPEGNIFAVAEA